MKCFSLCLLALFAPANELIAAALTHETTWAEDLTAPTRIALDPSSDLLYVTCPRTSEIAVFDTLGTRLGTITSVAHPEAITADGLGNLFVVSGNTVRKIDTDGNPLLIIGDPDEYFVSPNDVAVAADGRIYVACVTDDVLVSDSIRVFDADGSPLGGFGGFGRWYGHLNVPVSLEIDQTAGELYVVDQDYSRIMVYDLDGTGLREWGGAGNGNLQPGQFLRVWGCDFDEAGQLWVYDAILNTIQVFSPAGDFLDMISVPAAGVQTGLDLVVRGSHVYLVSQSAHSVLVYRIELTANRVDCRAVTAVDVTINPCEDDIVLHWKSLAGAVAYRVHRSASQEFTSGRFEVAGTVPDTSFVDVDVLSERGAGFYRVEPLFVSDVPAEGDQTSNALVDNHRTPMISLHERPHREWDGVSCASCHFAALGYPPRPMPEWWFSDQICKTCHVETGMAQPQQNHFTSSDTVYCLTCHNPHQHQPQFRRYFIDDVIPTPNSGNRILAFSHAEDFVHGAPDYDGICEICHTQTSYYRNSADGVHSHNAGTNCLMCHSHRDGFMPGASGGACDACHGAPPATGAHAAHFGGGVDQASYGAVQNLSDADVHTFSCGTCHPSSSSSFHSNGAVDVELYDPAAPAGSLKGLNPPTAAYDPSSGTCSNVYCHSATSWSSTTVYAPIYASGRPVLDANGNLTYPPYSVAEITNYVAMNWNGGGLDCDGCHRNGPQTAYPTVSGGVGQSHGWIDDWGYEDLHAYNMASDPLTCRTCHYATVTSEQSWSRDGWDITTYDDVAIADKSRHVNGTIDIQFDPVNSVAVRALEVSLASSSYDPDSRTCSSVPCHLAQETPEWGKPYRWWDTAECDQCHNYTGWFGSGRSLSSPNAHVDVTNHNCIDCHNPRQLHK